MGLNIVVGYLAEQLEYDEEGASWHREVLGDLNLVLTEAGEPPHHEPEEIPGGSQSWESYGYSGLHHVRRLAAWLAINRRLPHPCSYEKATDDAVLARFYRLHDAHLRGGRENGVLNFLKRRNPPFSHLILHSDAEGFYLPRAVPDVIFDRHSPQRDGIGGMVGSAKELLTECRELAHALSIPSGIDPEGEEIYKNVEAPPTDGEPWQRLSIETFVITRLIAACEKSLETGAAIVFS
ncbi:MAG: hypothetical protein WC729_27300 [Sphingomonas sp.]|uniref:hypothetical protein n=1 Tax=Sphingomonas sp. TaxID=28214 RepID=UPI003569866F